MVKAKPIENPIAASVLERVARTESEDGEETASDFSNALLG